MEEEIEFMPKHTVLVVDDEAAIREMLSISLDAADFNVLQQECTASSRNYFRSSSRSSATRLDDARYLGSRTVTSTQAR